MTPPSIPLDEQIASVERDIRFCAGMNPEYEAQLTAILESLMTLRDSQWSMDYGGGPAPLSPDIAPVCDWRQDTWDDLDSNTYNTSCGEAFSITEGKPSENRMKFCAYCGKPLVEHPYKPEIDDDA
jgi:hypothetical protein